MLYDMSWLESGQPFPPLCERERLNRYMQNAMLFDSDHFADGHFRHRGDYPGLKDSTISLYQTCANRIAQVIGNFDDIISVPVLLNYQKFMSLKMADLVCGEHPTITGADEAENSKLKWIQDNTNFHEQLYSAVIDLSRYGDCPIRVYKDEDSGYYTFTTWEAGQWFPIVSQDGTFRIKEHCLAWLENTQPQNELPDYYLYVQEFVVNKPQEIIEYKFHCGSNGTVVGTLEDGYPKKISTGFTMCPVFSLRPYAVSGTVYGYDDYVPLDAVLSEIITRVSQISAILDKHADPAMTGPVSMLTRDEKTGERYLKVSKFYGINEEDTPPSYLVWDGQLDAAFKQLEFLINQLYILSEMGAALTGGLDGSSNAVSGTAMRFKMVNPLAKARRVSNSLTNPLRRMLSFIGSNTPNIDEKTGEPGNGKDTPLPYGHITIDWKDGLPDDPREQLEQCKLASGETKLMPLEDCLMTYLGKSQKEASELATKLREQAQEALMQQQQQEEEEVANKPGPQDGTGVNPQKKGGQVTNFQSENNKKPEDK